MDTNLSEPSDLRNISAEVSYDMIFYNLKQYGQQLSLMQASSDSSRRSVPVVMDTSLLLSIPIHVPNGCGATSRFSMKMMVHHIEKQYSRRLRQRAIDEATYFMREYYQRHILPHLTDGSYAIVPESQEELVRSSKFDFISEGELSRSFNREWNKNIERMLTASRKTSSRIDSVIRKHGAVYERVFTHIFGLVNNARRKTSDARIIAQYLTFLMCGGSCYNIGSADRHFKAIFSSLHGTALCSDGSDLALQLSDTALSGFYYRNGHELRTKLSTGAIVKDIPVVGLDRVVQVHADCSFSSESSTQPDNLALLCQQ